MNGQQQQIYEFDNFRLDVGERQLLRDGEPVTLSAKAFDLLLVLIENNEHLLEKEELYALVWGEQIVEESNLTVQMSAIRRALGESRQQPHYIGTVIGRGYRFKADLRTFENQKDEDLIIESESVERVIIIREEEMDERLVDRGDGQKQLNPASFAQSPFSRFSLPKILLLAALLIVVGFIGFWIYQNRSQPTVSSAPESRQQMTMTRVTDGRPLGAPSISPDGKFIAFIENQFAGRGMLFVQQIDTSTVREILEPAERTFGCTEFSRDGSLIYYIVFDKRDTDGAFYSMPILGGAPKRIFGNLGSCFALSPDGKHVAFYRGDAENNQRHLMVAKLDGTGERALLTRARDEWSDSMSLAWSPDGNLITTYSNLETKNPESSAMIYGVDVASGTFKPLTMEKFSTVGKMSWTSDGRNLIFVGNRPNIGQKLFLMDYPSGEVRQLTNDLESYGNYGLSLTADSNTLVADIFERKSEIWSVAVNTDASKAIRVTSGTTDGRAGIASLSDGRVAYVARTINSLEIWTAKENGTETKTLTTDSFMQKDIAASPDGRYLFFASDQTGENHIFRMNADDGSETMQLTFGTNADTQPRVSPDGSWVIYASWNGKQSTIWKVPMTGGAAVQLTDYESGSPVFAPDGKTIACELRSDSRAKFGHIAIISAKGGQPLKSFQVMPFAYNYQTIQWTPDGKAIVFAKGEKGVFNLWQQPISGDAPERLTNFQSDAIWNFAYSRDGKRIFLSRGTTFVDVVLIKNFR